MQVENPDTRLRLLEAAGEVFAARGFKDATVREICSKAEANLAAVNYHFGSKERLYSEVLQYADTLSAAKHPPMHADLASKPPEEQLAWFVRQFLRRVFDSERPAWHDRLMAREMVDPTPALEELANKNIKPRALFLQGVVRRILGDEADDRRVQMCAASIVGQCLMYFRCKMMLDNLMPAIPLKSEETVDVLAKHITAFSLAAMRSGEFSPRGDRGGKP